jgi:hypothetical protein
MKVWLIAGAALAAVLGIAVGAAPTKAACTDASATSRGLNKDDVATRSARHLRRKINQWAQANGVKAVRVGPVSSLCVARTGGLAVCTSAARVCS